MKCYNCAMTDFQEGPIVDLFQGHNHSLYVGFLFWMLSNDSFVIVRTCHILHIKLSMQYKQFCIGLDAFSYSIKYTEDSIYFLQTQTIRPESMDIKLIFLHFALLVAVIQFGRSLTNKRKLCAEYIVIGRQRQLTSLDLVTYINITEPECMMQCVRHPDCMAYNTWCHNGTCQLQTSGHPCDELVKQKSSTFVKLRKCDRRASLKVETLSWNTYPSCVIWDRFDSKQKCPDEYLRGPDGALCIALVSIYGVYLPGWHQPNKNLHVVDMHGRKRICSDDGYLLKVATGCTAKWSTFTIGDPIPKGAVAGGSWTDGSLMYIVAAPYRYWKTGYYMMSSGKPFIMNHGDNEKLDPISMKMLCIT